MTQETLSGRNVQDCDEREGFVTRMLTVEIEGAIVPQWLNEGCSELPVRNMRWNVSDEDVHFVRFCETSSSSRSEVEAG